MSDTQTETPRLVWAALNSLAPGDGYWQAMAGEYSLELFLEDDRYELSCRGIRGTQEFQAETLLVAQIKSETLLRQELSAGLAALTAAPEPQAHAGRDVYAAGRQAALREAARIAREFGECGHVSGSCNRGIADEIEALAGKDGTDGGE